MNEEQINENINAVVKRAQEAVKERCDVVLGDSDFSLEDYKITIPITITPVHAVRAIEITMPWYWSYKSLNKLHQFFFKRAYVCFNRTKKNYDFPFSIWHENLQEYVVKERFNNARYKMKK